MIKENVNVWSTQNPFCFKYEFCKEIFGKVSNVILHEIVIYFDIYTNALSFNLMDVSHCLFNSGFCRTEHYFLIWTPMTVEYCNQILTSLV